MTFKFKQNILILTALGLFDGNRFPRRFDYRYLIRPGGKTLARVEQGRTRAD